MSSREKHGTRPPWHLQFSNQNLATPERPNGLQVLGHYTRWEEKKLGWDVARCVQAHSQPPGLGNMSAPKWAPGLMKEGSGPLG